MEQKIITSNSASGLNSKMKEMMSDGWTPIGPHGVVVLYSQNRFAGSQHTGTNHEVEYSQTMVKGKV